MVLEAERALSWAVLRWDEAKAPGSATDEASPAAAAAALLNEGEAYAAMEAYADMACSHQAVFSLLEELLDSSGRVAEDSGGSPRTSACSPRGPVSAGDTTAAQRWWSLAVVRKVMQGYEIVSFYNIPEDEKYTRPIGNETYKSKLWTSEAEAVMLMLLAACHPTNTAAQAPANEELQGGPYLYRRMSPAAGAVLPWMVPVTLALAGVEDWKVRLGEVQAALRELDLMSPRGSKLRRLRLAAVLLDAVGWLLAGRPRLAAEGVLLGLAACEAEGAYSDLRAITLLLPSRPSPPLPGCREVSDGGPQPCGDDGSDEAAANKAWAALEALHAWGQLQGTWCERMARQTTQPGSASRSGAGASAHMPGCPGQRRERSTKLTLRQVEERVLASAPARLHALHTFQELMEPLLRVTRHGLKSVSALASTPVLEENKETSASPARPPATPTRAEELRPGTDTPKAEAEAEAEGMIDLSLPAAGSPQPRAPVTSLEADRGQAVGGGEPGGADVAEALRQLDSCLDLVAVHGLEQNEEDEARSAYVAEWGLRHSFLPPQQALFTRLGATAPPSITPEPAVRLLT
eukprot:gene18085-21543_t